MKIRYYVLFAFFICAVIILVAYGSGDDTAPSSYDLRNVEGKCYLADVKSQSVEGEWWNSVGLCWACASVTSFESNLLMQGIVDDPTSDGANLSPWHIGCHIGYNHPNYEFNPTCAGDPPVPISYALDSTLQYGWGGSTLYTIDYLSSGKGLALECDAPIPLDDMHEREVLVPSEEDLSTHYMLREGLVYERQDYETEELYRKAIKEAVMDYGAVATPMYMCIGDFPGQAKDGYWRDDNFSEYYCDNEELANILVHQVSVVGWDDKYPIEGAPLPGAWLIKDSVCIGDGMHSQGYFWMSYEDTVFLKSHSYGVVFVADDGDGYCPGRLQTHDGLLSSPVSGTSIYEGDGYNSQGLDTWGCARFVAGENETLKAVGLATLNHDETITISIYGGWDDKTCAPTNLLMTKELHVAQKGYHVIDLCEDVCISEGQEFVIAVGFSAKKQGAEPFLYVTDTLEIPEDEKTYIASGEEGIVGTWTDYTDIKDESTLYLQAIFAG